MSKKVLVVFLVLLMAVAVGITAAAAEETDPVADLISYLSTPGYDGEQPQIGEELTITPSDLDNGKLTIVNPLVIPSGSKLILDSVTINLHADLSIEGESTPGADDAGQLVLRGHLNTDNEYTYEELSELYLEFENPYDNNDPVVTITNDGRIVMEQYSLFYISAPGIYTGDGSFDKADENTTVISVALYNEENDSVIPPDGSEALPNINYIGLAANSQEAADFLFGSTEPRYNWAELYGNVTFDEVYLNDRFVIICAEAEITDGGSINNNSHLIISEGGELTVGGEFNNNGDLFNKGTLNITGKLYNNNGLVSDGRLNIKPDAELHNGNYLQCNGGLNIEWFSAGDDDLHIGYLENNGSIDITADNCNDIALDTNGTIKNNGNIRLNSKVKANCYGYIENNNSIELSDEAELHIFNSVKNNDSFRLEKNAKLVIEGTAERRIRFENYGEMCIENKSEISVGDHGLLQNNSRIDFSDSQLTVSGELSDDDKRAVAINNSEMSLHDGSKLESQGEGIAVNNDRLNADSNSSITVKSLFINRGDLNIDRAILSVADGGKAENIGFINIANGSATIDGQFENYVEMNINKGGAVNINSTLLNGHEQLQEISDNEEDEPRYFDVFGRLNLNNGQLSINSGAKLTSERGCEINLNQSSVLTVQGSDSDRSKERAELENDGNINICDQATLRLRGKLTNKYRVENYAELILDGDESHIDNSFVLKVDDSATWHDCGAAAISTENIGDTAADHISEIPQLRLGFIEGESQINLNLADLYANKGQFLDGIMAIGGYDYAGEWVVLDSSKTALNITYNDENTPADAVVIGLGDDNRFTAMFNNWCSGTVTITLNEENHGFAPCSFPLELNCGSSFFRSSDYSQDNAVYAHTDNYCAESCYWFIKEDGFRADDLNNINICIKDADWQEIINEHIDQNSVYEDIDEGRLVRTDCDLETNELNRYLQVRIIRRNGEWENEEDVRYDICLTLNRELSDEQLKLECEVSGYNSTLELTKPVLTTEAGLSHLDGDGNHLIEYAVRLENNPGIDGFDFVLCYAKDSLEYRELQLNPALKADGFQMSVNPNYKREGADAIVIAYTAPDGEAVNDLGADNYLFKLVFTVKPQGDEGELGYGEFTADYDFDLFYFQDDTGNLSGHDLDVMPLTPDDMHATGRSYRWGDVLRDNKVNIKDAVRLAQAISNRITLDAAEAAAADVTHCGDTKSINNLLKIMRYLAGYQVDMSAEGKGEPTE